MTEQENNSKTNPDCPCAFKFCERHGKCEACQEYHHARGEKSACGK